MDEVKKPYGVVYLIVNMINGKMYVGQTTRDVWERFAEHCYDTKSLIGKAIHKYGKENFLVEVLAECYAKEQLNTSEIFFIKILNTVAPKGYNLTEGGEGGVPSVETREKQSKLASERLSDPKERKKISESLIGRKDSEEVKARKSAAQKKRYAENPKACQKQSEGLFKRFSNPDERKKQSDIMKKYKSEHPITEETRRAISAKKKKYRKQVYCPELDILFESVSLAAKFFKTEPTRISRVCLGKRKIYHGYHFEFVSE